MMKNLLMTAALVASFSAANAQGFKVTRENADVNTFNVSKAVKNVNGERTASTASLTVPDTLWYFYNKQRFINTVANQGFYTIQGSIGTSTNGDLVEFGSAFLNPTPGASVTISDVAFLASRQANSTSTVIPVKVYVYNATPAGIPTTKVDSAMAAVTGTNPNFWLASFTTPKTVTGSFFISYRLEPTANTDTLRAWVTSASTPTSGAPASERFGEGLSFTRAVAAGTPAIDAFFSNTNFYGAANGLDLEAVVVPMVTYSIASNFTASAPNSTATPGSYCTNQAINFTNATTPTSLVYNRQFNFNKFITYWQPLTGFSFSVAPNAADPIDNWAFSNTGTTYTTTNASNTPSAPGVLTTSLTIKYRPSPFLPSTQVPSISDVKTATYNVVACTTGTATGINQVAGFENLSVYPNPTNSGKTTISGLTGSNTIAVYDMLGQLVSTLVSDKEVVAVDLSNKANGNYIVKIVNSNSSVKVVKIINQN